MVTRSVLLKSCNVVFFYIFHTCIQCKIPSSPPPRSSHPIPLAHPTSRCFQLLPLYLTASNQSCLNVRGCGAIRWYTGNLPVATLPKRNDALSCQPPSTAFSDPSVGGTPHEPLPPSSPAGILRCAVFFSALAPAV